jgi:hypothetical protein
VSQVRTRPHGFGDLPPASHAPAQPIAVLARARQLPWQRRWWGGVLKYDDSYPVTLAPKDICTLPDIGLHRREQDALEHLLRDIVLLHALLCVPADDHMAEPWDFAVKVGHLEIGV